jgi:hypothetical protein
MEFTTKVVAKQGTPVMNVVSLQRSLAILMEVLVPASIQLPVDIDSIVVVVESLFHRHVASKDEIYWETKFRVTVVWRAAECRTTITVRRSDLQMDNCIFLNGAVNQLLTANEVVDLIFHGVPEVA